MESPEDVSPKHVSSQQHELPNTKEAAQVVQASSERTPSTTESDNAKGPEPGPEYLGGTKLYLLFASLLLTVLIMTIDTSIVSTAIPRITDSFHSIKEIGWYGAAYLFTNSTCQPAAGRIYRHLPMKISYICFLALFEVGSLICATSVSSAMFIIGRAVAGIGSSGLINGALTIVGSASAPEKKPMLMGLIMGVAGAGQLIGPLIGGAITEKTTWRWCFYINIPCGVLVIFFITLISFPNNLPRRKIDNVIRDFDLIGFAIFTPAVIMLMMALQWGGLTYPWSSAVIISLLTVSGVMLIALVFWEHHAGTNAMFPAHLLRLRVVSSACATGFFNGATILIMLYYLPLWFQAVEGKSPLGSAVSTLASFCSSLAFAVLNGFLCPRVIPYLTVFAIVGGILSTLGIGFMSIFTPSTTAGIYVGLQILAGSGRGLTMQTPVQSAQLHISRDDLAVGTAVVTFFQFFGGSFMLAIAQTLFENLLRRALNKYVPDLDANIIIQNGATDLRGVVSAADLGLVKLAYNDAITKTLILSAASSALAVFTALGMGWKKVPKKAKGKRKDKDKGETKEENIEEKKENGNEA